MLVTTLNVSKLSCMSFMTFNGGIMQQTVIVILLTMSLTVTFV